MHFCVSFVHSTYETYLNELPNLAFSSWQCEHQYAPYIVIFFSARHCANESRFPYGDGVREKYHIAKNSAHTKTANPIIAYVVPLFMATINQFIDYIFKRPRLFRAGVAFVNLVVVYFFDIRDIKNL